MSHFTDLLSYVRSGANIVPLRSNQRCSMYPTYHISYFILLTRATASIFLSFSFHSLFPEDLISSMKTGFSEPPPKPIAGYREQGSHHPRAHWFILHCNSDMWYTCSHALGVPVLAMAYLDIVEAHPEIQPLPKAICLPSKQD